MAVQFNVTYFVSRPTITNFTTITATASPATHNGSDLTLDFYPKRFHYYYEPNIEIVLTIEKKSLPANGFIVFEVLGPLEANSFTIEVSGHLRSVID